MKYRVEKKKEKSSKLSQLGIFIVAVALLSGSLGYLANADGPTGFGTVIEPGSMVVNSAYIIYSDTAEYFVKNGSTGANEYGSANATLALTYALSLLEADGGGSIIIRAGYYEVYDTLSIANNTIVSGEGQSTVIRTDYYDWCFSSVWSNNITIENMAIRSRAGGYGVLLDNCTNAKIIGLSSSSCSNHIYVRNCQNVVIRDCTISGGMYGIRLFWGDQITITNNVISSVTTDGMQLNAITNSTIVGNTIVDWGLTNLYRTGIGLYANGGDCYNVVINSNSLFGAAIDKGYIGIYLGAESSLSYSTHHCSVVGNTLIGQNMNLTYQCIGIYSHAYAGTIDNVHSNTITANSMSGWTVGASFAGGKYQIFTGNTITDSGEAGIGVTIAYYCQFSNNVITNPSREVVNASDGIVLAGSRYNLIQSNLVQDLDSPTRMRCGVRESDSGCISNAIKLNVIKNPVYLGIVAQATAVVEFNEGWITENKGTATITTSTSVIFNHGLATTPTLVLASFNLASYGNYTWTATTTQITITVSTSGTYTVYWYAEV